MRQLYYTVQILLRGRGSNFIKLVSLTLGLLIGILLFSQIAYELSYENFYKDPENVALMRCRRVKEGIPDKDYDDSTFRPAAADLWEALPDLIESASLSVNFYQPDCYIGRYAGHVCRYAFFPDHRLGNITWRPTRIGYTFVCLSLTE